MSSSMQANYNEFIPGAAAHILSGLVSTQPTKACTASTIGLLTRCTTNEVYEQGPQRRSSLSHHLAGHSEAALCSTSFETTPSVSVAHARLIRKTDITSERQTKKVLALSTMLYQGVQSDRTNECKPCVQGGSDVLTEPIAIFQSDGTGHTAISAAATHVGRALHDTPKHPKTVRLATANVNMLHPKDFKRKCFGDGDGINGRIASLDAKFHHAELDIIGIQESRIQGDLQLSSQHYHIRSSGATADGCLGVQLWVSMDFMATIVAIFPVSPRLLISVLAVGSHQVIVVVAHAPTEESSNADKNSFWSLLQLHHGKIHHLYPSAMAFLLIDGNAEVGSNACSAIGTMNPDCENDNGARFRDFLLENNMVAVNTFAGGGPTWVGSRGHPHRIDYVCCDAHVTQSITYCNVDPEADISTATRYDHFIVALDFSFDLLPVLNTSPEPNIIRFRIVCDKDGRTGAVDENAADSVRKHRPKIDSDNVSVPWRVERFQKYLADIVDTIGSCSSDSANQMNDKLSHWNEAVHSAAIKAFGKSKRKPRKCWISNAAWTIIQGIAPVRRQMFTCSVNAKRMACIPWVAQQYCLEASMWKHKLVTLQKASRWILRHDWNAHLDDLACQAERAALCNNTSLSYSIVKKLSGTVPSALNVVKDKRGNSIGDAAGIKQRWQEHFAEVFGAEVVGKDAMPTPSFGNRINHSVALWTRPAVQKQIDKLPSRKALGPDGISAEIIKAGGLHYSEFLFRLMCDICRLQSVPNDWRGGRIVNL